MKDKMSRWGIGPVFGMLSIAYGTLMLALDRGFYPLFQIDLVPYGLLFIFGIILIIAGMLFILFAAIAVMRAYNADRLVTDGMYRCCRHPLYAAWVVFIVPGIGLLLNSWPVLTTPVFMYVILAKLVKQEELYLERVFGAAYLEYQKKVPRILPYGLIK